MVSEAKDNDDIICPFCGECGFDKIGLKIHLQNYCEEFESTDTLTRRMFP